ncbi:flagellar protein [Clostridium sp. D2Q-11]|uniref:Flagellar protein n=1 Tax=Anaeromonas frigoriresistens TaxID=2683708 RepID=A0A942UV82_9FIRM|nr:TIGR02530 family flagellar biosynthesis protein [Anaeromonas frigoriresistens]MBS4539849.1 flagellar protein [Anaeromonas frigoriresistens]
MKTYNIHQISSNITKSKIDNKQKNDKNTFDQILKDVENIKFSKHAVKRMDDRDISINNEDVLRINHAMNQARDKGVDQALILMDNKAFIASVRNNTIITTINSEQLKNNVFSNIDGAVIV